MVAVAAAETMVMVVVVVFRSNRYQLHESSVKRVCASVGHTDSRQPPVLRLFSVVLSSVAKVTTATIVTAAAAATTTTQHNTYLVTVLNFFIFRQPHRISSVRTKLEYIRRR